eukprot:TRINITY_DN26775_c0_g1_i1.p1 TRINITY_DN26775_c0_g1~~TRINITY_DN26775_c0_g1_i1.p1  ORF type:complete len:1521 (-),score=239.74 TRINITY_DN26775_c0_g1_i1:182-4744(-)
MSRTGQEDDSSSSKPLRTTAGGSRTPKASRTLAGSSRTSKAKRSARPSKDGAAETPADDEQKQKKKTKKKKEEGGNDENSAHAAAIPGDDEVEAGADEDTSATSNASFPVPAAAPDSQTEATPDLPRTATPLVATKSSELPLEKKANDCKPETLGKQVSFELPIDLEAGTTEKTGLVHEEKTVSSLGMYRRMKTVDEGVAQKLADTMGKFKKLVIEHDDVPKHLPYHFVSLKRNEDGVYLWEPSKLTVEKDSIVHFSWRAETTPGFYIFEVGENGAEHDASFSCFECDKEERHCNYKFDVAKTYKIGNSCFPEAVCTVKVYSVQWITVMRVMWALFSAATPIALIITIVAVASSYIDEDVLVRASSVTCSSTTMTSDICVRVHQAVEYVIKSGGPAFYMATLVFALALVVSFVRIVKPRPLLSSFGRGFDGDKVYTGRLWMLVFVSLLPVLLLFDNLLNVRYTHGLKQFMALFDSLVKDILNEVFSILVGVEHMLDVGRKFQKGGSLIDDKQIKTIVSFEGNIRYLVNWTLEIITLGFTARAFFHYLGLLCMALCIAYGIAGLFRLSPDLLRTSRSLSYWCLVGILLSIGFNGILSSVWQDFYDGFITAQETLKSSSAGTNTTAGSAISAEAASASMQLLSFCGSGNVPVDDIATQVGRIFETIDRQSCAIGHCTNLSNTDVLSDVSTLVKEFKTFSMPLVYQLGQPDADLTELGFNLDTNISASELGEALGYLIQAVDIFGKFKRCDHIHPFLDRMLRTLDTLVLPYAKGMVFIEMCAAGFFALWLILSKVASHVLERPKKRWKDDVSRRWFRFRFSYRAAVQVRKQTIGDVYYPHRVERRYCPTKMSLLQDIVLTQTVLLVYVFFWAGLSLTSISDATAPGGPWLLAACWLLLVASPISFVGGIKQRYTLRNKLLRISGLVLSMIAVAFLAVSFFADYSIVKIWYDALQSKQASTCEFPYHQIELSSQSMVNSSWMVSISGPCIESGDRIALMSSTEAECPPKDAVAISDAARTFGRSYSFNTSVPAGLYTICWCSATSTCDALSQYSTYVGDLMVDITSHTPRTLSNMVLIFESAVRSALLIPAVVVRCLYAFLGLFRCVYSAHISDRQRRLLRAAMQKAFDFARREDDCFRSFMRYSRTTLMGLGLLALFTGLIAIFSLVFFGSYGQSCYWQSGCAVSAPNNLSSFTERVSCDTCCNLQNETCNKTVDMVAFASSHNTMSSELETWAFPNNLLPLEAALKAGLRGLMIDVHYKWPLNATRAEKEKPGVAYLCHGFCTFGRTPLVDSFRTLARFLDASPRELIVLIFEQYVATASIVEDMRLAGLMKYVGYAHPNASTPWPTVGQMISNGHRLLIFSDKNTYFRGFVKPSGTSGKQITLANSATPTKHDWWHDLFTYMTETPYTYVDVESMMRSCDFKRGAPSAGKSALAQAALSMSGSAVTPGGEQHRLVILNHFVSNPLPHLASAPEANSRDRLQNRSLRCRSEWHHQINFPTVDFWSVGDVVDITNTLNDMVPR